MGKLKYMITHLSNTIIKIWFSTSDMYTLSFVPFYPCSFSKFFFLKKAEILNNFLKKFTEFIFFLNEMKI